jgi:predicted metal-dependent hydrolase
MVMTVPHNYRDLNRAIELFNNVRFFDAHEELEDVWRRTPRNHPSRQHVQGLVQLAVAFHHASTGNRTGARSVLERAVRNLEGADASFPELDLAQLRLELKHWQHHLTASESGLDESGLRRSVIAPALPKFLLRG